MAQRSENKRQRLREQVGCRYVLRAKRISASKYVKAEVCTVHLPLVKAIISIYSDPYQHELWIIFCGLFRWPFSASARDGEMPAPRVHFSGHHWIHCRRRLWWSSASFWLLRVQLCGSSRSHVSTQWMLFEIVSDKHTHQPYNMSPFRASHLNNCITIIVDFLLRHLNGKMEQK